MQNNCKSADGTFGAKCSAEQFRKLTLDGAAAVQSQWDKCTAQINSGNANITLADSDLAGKAAQQVSDYLQATVVTVLPKPENSHHYRGDLSAVRTHLSPHAWALASIATASRRACIRGPRASGGHGR